MGGRIIKNKETSLEIVQETVFEDKQIIKQFFPFGLLGL
jgi:hypothetical protein